MGRICKRWALAILALTLVHCTRQQDKETVRVVIPFNNSKTTLAAGDFLKMAVVNIQVPGRATPIVQEFNYESAPVPWGTPVSLVVNNVPSGPGLVIQFLGVFETAQGASMLLTYGDAVANVGIGVTNVTVAASAAGTANREGRISGRYYTDDFGGPTGSLVAFFYPPNGKPRMAVSKDNITAGYFNIFALDSIPLTYVHLDSGITIFGGLTLSSPAIAPAIPNVAKYSIPAYYRRENRNGTITVKKQVASDYTIGYFKSGGATISLTNFRACSAGNTVEGLSGLYLNYNVGNSGKLENQLMYNSLSPTANDMQKVAGGVEGASYEDWATQIDCDPSFEGDMMFFHNRISYGGDEGVAGMRPPFRIIDPFATYGGFMRQYFDAMSNTIPQMKLEWAYLPGAAPGDFESGVDGVDILSLYSMNYSGGGGGGGNEPVCADYIAQGYQVIASLTTPDTSYLDENPNLDSSNYYAFHYMLCPFALDAVTGAKKYVGSIIQANCQGSCGELEHYGWGTSAITISSGTTPETLGQSHARVTDVDAFSSSLFTTVTLTLSSSAPFTAADAGSEVMLSVIANGSDGDCGMSLSGQPIMPGERAFARLLGSNGTQLLISKGTFLDDLDFSFLPDAVSSSNFCYVQAVKVLHFTSVSLAADINLSSFHFDDTGGGVLPMRVSGEISVSGNVSIVASGSGFQSGLSTGYAGSGSYGPPAYGNWNPFSNAGNSTVGVAGGGAGPMSDGGNGALTGGITIAEGGMAGLGGSGGGGYMVPMMFGGGGGDYGGHGGGAVLLASRYINVPSGSSLNIFANGLDKNSGYKGGGGGGSVAVMAQRASGSISINARGGSTGSSFASNPEGGAGGGGYISRYICDITNLSFTTNVAAGTGPFPSMAPGAAQNGYVYVPANGSENPACR